MTEAQTAPVTHNAQPGQGEAPADVDVRAAQLIDDIRAGKFADDEGEEAADTPAVAPAKTKEPEQAADTKGPGEEEAEEPQKPETDVEKERRERIARAQELEKQARKEASAAAEERRQVAEMRSAVEQERRQVAELKQKLAEQEKIWSDGPAFLARAKKLIPPDQLGEWLADSMNPVKQAEWAARQAAKEASPEIEALRAEIAALKQESGARRVQTTQQQVIATFTDYAKSSSAELPHVGVLLEKRPHELVDRAEAAAQRFLAKGESYDYNSVLREVESELSGFASLFSPKTPGENAAPSDTAANANAAQAPRARTLTNRNTAGRSTIVNDDDSYAGLNDRAEDLKRRLRPAG